FRFIDHLYLAQVLMDELHRHRSLADSRSHPLHRTMPHITNGKETGDIGLEQKRIAVERPSLRPLPVMHKIRTSQNESAFVALHHTSQPIGSRQCSDED